MDSSCHNCKFHSMTAWPGNLAKTSWKNKLPLVYEWRDCQIGFSVNSAQTSLLKRLHLLTPICFSCGSLKCTFLPSSYTRRHHSRVRPWRNHFLASSQSSISNGSMWKLWEKYRNGWEREESHRHICIHKNSIKKTSKRKPRSTEPDKRKKG